MDPEKRSTNCIPTFTGRLVDIIEFDPRCISIYDVAHALSNICRFTGHVSSFYSVAQHSVLVSELVPPEFALWGLLHDSSEAYLSDISRPLKYSTYMTGYRELEHGVQRAIYRHFGLVGDEPSCVKHADNVALATEFRDVVTTMESGLGLPSPHCLEIVPLLPQDAEKLFLRMYKHLTGVY